MVVTRHTDARNSWLSWRMLRYARTLRKDPASIVVELDGSQHAEQSDYDMRRDMFLRSRGFRVLRFCSNDVSGRTEVILETIYEALYRTEMDGRLD